MSNILELRVLATGSDRSSKNKIQIFRFHNVDVLGGFDYQKNITIEEFSEGIQTAINSEKMLEDDEISQMAWVKREVPPGFMSMDEDSTTLWYFVIQVGRYTWETGEEYAERQSELYKTQREEERKEKELYLRLKAKYETI